MKPAGRYLDGSFKEDDFRFQSELHLDTVVHDINGHEVNGIHGLYRKRAMTKLFIQ